MMKKVLFIIDKTELRYFEFNHLVTDFWLIWEFLNRGHEVFITTNERLSLVNSKAFALCSKSFIKDGDICHEKEVEIFPLEKFSLVMFRPDPPVDIDYINATYILDFAKVPIINSPCAVRSFNEKIHANIFSELMPKNLVTANKNQVKEFLAEEGEIVLKPLNCCFGGGVMHLVSGDKNTNSLINSMTQNGKTAIMVQKFLPSVEFGDKRVLTLGSGILEECVVKLPGKDDFKFNTHSCEYVKKGELLPSERKKFKKAAEKLSAMGIQMAGFDVIDEQIIEINVTSPCYFIKEINKYFSTNLEKRIADYCLNLYK